MASFEEQLLAMASGDPNTYAATAFPQDQGAFGPIVAAKERTLEQALIAASPREGSSGTITNVPEMRGQATAYITPQAPAQQLAAGGGKYAFLDEFRTRLEQSKDWNETQNILLDLNENASNRLQQAQSNVAKIAEQDLNLPAYRSKLARMAAEDRRNYELQGMDSPETAQMRAAVLKMEDQARKTTQEILQANPELKAFASTVNGIAQKYGKVADQQLTARNKKLEKEELQKEAAQDIIAGSDPAVRASFEKLYPQLKGDDIAYARFIAKGGKPVEALAKGYIQPNQYLEAAVAGDPMSARLAALTQSERTGLPIEVTAKDTQDALTYAKNPTLLLDTLTKPGLMDPETLTKVKAIRTKLALASGKEKEALYRSLNDFIPELMHRKANARIENDLESWPVSPGTPSLLADPVFGSLYNNLKVQTGKKPTLLQAGNAYLNEEGISNEEKTVRQARLVEAYEAAASKINKGIFTSPVVQSQFADNSRKVKQSLTQQIVADTFAKKLGVILGDMGRGSQQYNIVNQVMETGKQVVQSEVKFLDELFGGMMNGGNK